MRTLSQIAYARSGDKGEDATLGVIAYTEKDYQILKEVLTSDRVGNYFQELKPTSIERYLLPNLLAVHFVLRGVLPGGASRNLRLDSQGKALGVRLLQMPITVN